MTSQIILFSQPRSGSHLLERMIDEQSGSTPFFRPFENPWHLQTVRWLRQSNYRDGMLSDERTEFENKLKLETCEWEEKLSKAQNDVSLQAHCSRLLLILKQRQRLMIHTHHFFPTSPDRLLEVLEASTSKTFNGANFTLLPNDLLLRPGTVPILSIRHPRRVVPSAIRAMQKVPGVEGRANLLVLTNPIWARLLYEFYVLNNVVTLIVDADDYMTDENFVREMCKKAGLDPQQAKLSWDTTSNDERENFAKPYQDVQTTLMQSTRPNASRAAKNIDIDLAEEEKKWKEEFGEQFLLLKELVELSTTHYDYLFQHRFKV